MKKISEADNMEISSLRDRVQEILGQINEASQNPNKKANKETLNFCAAELHKSADQLIWIVSRLK